MKTISSRQNPLVRAFRLLAATPDPDLRRLLLDGVHLVQEARAAGLEFETVAVADGRSEAAELAEDLRRAGIGVVAVTEGVMSALSPVRTPSGIVAIAKRPAVDVRDICAHPRALVLVAVDVQDPGNLGALVRAAEAGGATGVIVCGGSAHPFSWKAVRGSMGSALRLPITALARVSDAIDYCRDAGLRTAAAVPREGRTPRDVDWRVRSAIVVGGEGAGLTTDVIDVCEERVTIPMQPPVESLNVAVAGALLVFEAARQRKHLEM
jgi:TrmH family RNA methyltransferase